MTMIITRPFEPKGVTVNLAVTASSQSVALTRSGMGTQTVRLAVAGIDPVFVAFGTSIVTTATTTGMYLLPNSVETFLLPREVTHIAAISSGTASTLYATTGEGN